MNKPGNTSRLLLLCGILVSVLIVFYCGIRLQGSAVFSDKASSDTEQTTRKTITYNGVDYFPRQDITVVLAMGIDEEGEVKSSGFYNNTGEADVISLIIFDEENETIDIFNLHRDTMVKMPVLGIGGRKAGMAYGQLALSHTYGNGLEESCENTRETVEGLINGLTVDYYISANMDAISIVNDAVGGVTVNVTDDFSDASVYIPMGEVTLIGNQAESFVRVRKGVADQLNSSRMERQEEYVKGFITALTAKRESSDTFALKLYEDISRYIVTDISAVAFSGMFDRYEEYTLNKIITPAGENCLGSEFNEFYLDEGAFEKIIIDTFYKEK